MLIDTKIQHVTPSDGNVFADLGFAPAEAKQLKTKAQNAVVGMLARAGRHVTVQVA